MADTAIMAGGAAGLYRNTAVGGAAFGNPQWLENLLTKDVTPSGGWDFVEASSRLTPLKLYGKAQLDKPHQVVMRADILSTEYPIWVTAAASRKATLDLLILNAKLTEVGAVGYRGMWLVSLTAEAQEIGGNIYSTFELRPTIDTLGNLVYLAKVNPGPSITYTSLSWVA